MPKLFDNKPKGSNVDLKNKVNSEEEPQSSINPELEQFAEDQVADAEGFKASPSEEEEEETTIDLAKLDESTLLKYPIVAKALNDEPMAVIKPKDSAMSFRWVFFDRAATGSTARVVALNIQRYKFWGFEFAHLDDIEGGEEALGSGMVDDGGLITNYDTVLMKINKVRLMAHYKSGLLKSLEQTNSALAKGVKEAELEYVQSGAARKVANTHPKATVEFYAPGAGK